MLNEGCVMDDVDVSDDDRALHARLNELLADWHAWSAGHAYSLGYPCVSAACRQARCSRQYDDSNGSLDAHVDAVVMEAVDAVLDGIGQPWRTALSVQARNLSTGMQVWSSPRLPVNQVARLTMLAEARNKFAQALARADILW